MTLEFTRLNKIAKITISSLIVCAAVAAVITLTMLAKNENFLKFIQKPEIQQALDVSLKGLPGSAFSSPKEFMPKLNLYEKTLDKD